MTTVAARSVGILPDRPSPSPREVAAAEYRRRMAETIRRQLDEQRASMPPALPWRKAA